MILADFVIGAQALTAGSLLTWDLGIYGTSFGTSFAELAVWARRDV